MSVTDEIKIRLAGLSDYLNQYEKNVQYLKSAPALMRCSSVSLIKERLESIRATAEGLDTHKPALQARELLACLECHIGGLRLSHAYVPIVNEIHKMLLEEVERRSE